MSGLDVPDDEERARNHADPSDMTPAEWDAYLAEGNARQARKAGSRRRLIRDEAGRILLVDPNYKPDWDRPGGMAEANSHRTTRRDESSSRSWACG